MKSASIIHIEVSVSDPPGSQATHLMRNLSHEMNLELEQPLDATSGLDLSVADNFFRWSRRPTGLA